MTACRIGFRPTIASRVVLGVMLVAALLVTPRLAVATGATWRVNPRVSGAMVFGPDGALYIADSVNAYIYRLDAAGNSTVIAGIGPRGPGGFPVVTKDHGWTEATNYTGDGGPATQAQLSFPVGLAFDAEGNLYFADHGNDVVRKIDTNGIIT